jgi:murein DD-endopeptidase MepM/ murein hydrolase activator NlpD
MRSPQFIEQLYKCWQIKLYRWLFLAVIFISTCSLPIIWQAEPTISQSLPPTPIQITTNWKNASFPVENFKAYTSGFGYRISPTSGQWQFHKGLDIAAPLGSYIRNWWTGEIVELSDDTACGTTIKIRSGSWEHIYCHLNGSVQTANNSKYLVDSEGGIQLVLGQKIPVGARMARVGMTGSTTGPHLHWGLLYKGEYVDPALVLREMFKQQNT